MELKTRIENTSLKSKITEITLQKQSEATKLRVTKARDSPSASVVKNSTTFAYTTKTIKVTILPREYAENNAVMNKILAFRNLGG